MATVSAIKGVIRSLDKAIEKLGFYNDWTEVPINDRMFNFSPIPLKDSIDIGFSIEITELMERFTRGEFSVNATIEHGGYDDQMYIQDYRPITEEEKQERREGYQQRTFMNWKHAYDSHQQQKALLEKELADKQQADKMIKESLTKEEREFLRMAKKLGFKVEKN